MDTLQKILLVVPTYIPGTYFAEFLKAYGQQTIKPDHAVIVDSGAEIEHWGVDKYGFEVKSISKHEFNHGGTRQDVLQEYPGSDYVIYLTQDAILSEPDSLGKIISYLCDKDIAAVCGRQLPKRKAGPIEAHARLFNYSDVSAVRTYQDKNQLGLKAAFLSNSFAAYRISALEDVGGFPDNVIFGEDMYVAAQMLKSGYKIAYASDACVYHSHSYSMSQEFRRYFDMGVFHAKEPWLRQEFGVAESEGLKFVVSEMKYLLRHAFWKIPEAILRTVLRYAGFRLGLAEHRIPLNIKRKISMNPSYFKLE